jgi:hypothetical protein
MFKRPGYTVRMSKFVWCIYITYFHPTLLSVPLRRSHVASVKQLWNPTIWNNNVQAAQLHIFEYGVCSSIIYLYNHTTCFGILLNYTIIGCVLLPFHIGPYCNVIFTEIDIAVTSRVRFPMVSLEFFVDIILSVALWPWVWLSL